MNRSIENLGLLLYVFSILNGKKNHSTQAQFSTSTIGHPPCKLHSLKLFITLWEFLVIKYLIVAMNLKIRSDLPVIEINIYVLGQISYKSYYWYYAHYATM